MIRTNEQNLVPEPYPTEQLVKQRIRNRIIEYLELAASADAQLGYERDVPIANVPVEMIEMWSDVVIPTRWDWYGPPVFSGPESAAIRAFHETWRAVGDGMPEPLTYSIRALIGTPLWDSLAADATAALRVFEARGRFSETEEIVPPP